MHEQPPPSPCCPTQEPLKPSQANKSRVPTLEKKSKSGHDSGCANGKAAAATANGSSGGKAKKAAKMSSGKQASMMSFFKKA